MPPLVTLMRPRISLAVAGGSLFGALYFGGGEPWRGLVTAAGAGILCAACSALNQVQERDFDRRMERTRNRPVASGAISVATGTLVAAILGLIGLALFTLAGGLSLLGLGVAVPVIYNGFYTPLKQITPMALLVGGLSGALPPLTGWVGAGGSITDPTILGVTTIFFLWQVPHFWLLHEKHKADYERAGFATLERSLSATMHRPLLGLWVSAYFLGLGCLALNAGPGAAAWLLPPAILILAGFALTGVARNQRRMASAAVYGSLPLTLTLLLTSV